MARRTFIVESDLSASAAAVSRIGAFCRRNGVSGNMLAVIELCTVEALNNAIEHGHATTPEIPVEVDVDVEGGELVVEVRDRGLGLPAHVLRAAPRDVTWETLHTLPERGLGLVILRRAMDEVSYHVGAEWNSLVLRKHVGDATSARREKASPNLRTPQMKRERVDEERGRGREEQDLPAAASDREHARDHAEGE